MQTIAPLPQHFRESVSASVLMFWLCILPHHNKVCFFCCCLVFDVIFCSIRGKSLTWRCTRPLGAEFTFRGSVGRDGHTWSHLTTSMVEFWVDFRRRSYGTRTKPQESHTISHELHTSNAHLSVPSGFLELTQFVDEP